MTVFEKSPLRLKIYGAPFLIGQWIIDDVSFVLNSDQVKNFKLDEVHVVDNVNGVGDDNNSDDAHV